MRRLDVQPVADRFRRRGRPVRIPSLRVLAGSTGALLGLAIAIPAIVLAAAPSNDAFEAAAFISTQPFTDDIDLAEASIEAAEPYQGCNSNRTRTAWYAYAATETGVVVAEIAAVAPTFGDHALAWYELTGTGITGLTAKVCRYAGPTSTVRVEAGKVYYLQVSDNGSGGGPLSLAHTFYPPPPNDDVEDTAVVPSFPWSTTVDLYAATFQASEPNACSLPLSRRTAWYTFESAASGTVTVTPTATWPSPQLAAYGPDGSVCGAAGAPLRFAVAPGAKYLVQAGNGLANFGTLEVDFTFASGPPNDTFSHAAVIDSLPFAATVDIAPATLEPLERDPCTWGMTRSVWYSFVAPTSGIMSVDLRASALADPRLTAYYVASGPGLAGLSSGRCATASVTTIPLVAGRTYYLQVSDGGSGGGMVSLELAFLPRPPNDSLASATFVGGLPFTDGVDTRAATLEEGEPRPCGGSTRTVWYRFTPVEGGVVTVDTAGSTFLTSALGVYRASGSGFAGLVAIACRPETPSLVVLLEAGVTYYVQVADSLPSTQPQVGGALALSITATPGATPVPANDMFSLAVTVDTFPFTHTVDLSTATLETGESIGGCGNYFAGSVWYRFTAPADGAVSLAGTSSTGSLLLNMWRAGTTPGVGGLQSIGVNACAGTVPVQGGVTYYLQAASVVYTTPGVMELHISLIPPPANDDLADAMLVSGTSFTDPVDLRTATSEPGEPHACGGSTHTVWYAFTAPTSGHVRVDADRLWDPVGAVYRSTGPGFGGLTSVTCRYLADGPLTFNAVGGVTYLMQVSDWWSGGSIVDLRVTFFDRTPPLVSITGLSSTYAVDAPVAITATAIDELDGPLQPACALTNNGSGVVVSDACAIDPWAWELGPGSFTFSATATDAAGNAATASGSFRVVVTYPSVTSLTAQWVWRPGIARDLVALLDGAALAEARGQLKAEAGKLADYRALLRAQAGKSITAADAERLIEFSLAL